MECDTEPGKPLRRTPIIFLSVIGFGIAMCAILAVWLRNIETRDAQQRFQRYADVRQGALENGLREAVDALVSVNQLFDVMPDVNRKQFQTFTEPLLERYPHVYAYAYQRVVKGVDRQRYEAARQTSYPGFTIREFENGKLVVARDKPRYRVTEYIEPLARNEVAIGFDASSRPYQNEAVRRAAANGQPASTGLFRLLQEPDSQLGFSVVMPVYRPGAAANGMPHSLHDVAGYTVAVFRAGDLAEKILRGAGLLDAEDIDVALYAGTEPLLDNLAFRHAGSASAATDADGRWRQHSGDLHGVTRIFEVAGGTWLMVVSPSASIQATLYPHTASWLVLFIGSMTILLFVAYINALARRASELAKANDALRRSQRELRELAAHQEQVKEDERKRIAREIHDDLGQNLLALRIDVTLLESRTTDVHPAINSALQGVLRQIDVTVRSVRSILNNLRPRVLDLGLRKAIEWQVRQLNERHRTEFRLSVENGSFGATLDDEQATTIFRIVQESLTNVVRHANATLADVVLSERNGKLRIMIADDGVGSFPGDQRKPRSFGLVGIKERIAALGGMFKMESVPGRGTTLEVEIAVLQAVNAEEAQHSPG